MNPEPLLALSVTWNDAPETAAAEVAAALQTNGLQATWILGDRAPATSKLVARHAAEIGFLAAPGLLTGDRALSVVVEALLRARQRASRLGLSFTTLVADAPPPRRHVDLLAKYGVRCLTSEASAARATAATSLRYGLWSIPVAVAWPWTAERSWFRSATLDKSLRHASQLAGAVHVRVDVDAVAAAGRQSRVGRDLEQLAAMAAARAFTAAALSGAADRLSCPRPRLAPARSILRAA